MKTVKHYGGNAVEVDGILVAYKTQVARIAPDGSFHRLWSDYSATTMRHINKFREAHGLPRITKAQWEEMEVEE